MTFDDYQKQALTTLIKHQDPLMGKTIMVLGITGEASEIAEKWKKLVAYRDGIITEQDKQELAKEIGDVLWYLSVFADMLGLSMDEIATNNAAKRAACREAQEITDEGHYETNWPDQRGILAKIDNIL